MAGWLNSLLGALGLGGSEASQAFKKQGGPLAFRMLQDEGVRQELGLTFEQMGLIGKYTREARQKHRKTYAGIKAMEEGRRREEGQKLMTLLAEDAMRAIHKAGILTEPQQRRLQQLTWQNRGVSVFTDPNLVKALSMTEGQQHMVLNILEDSGKKLREILKGEAAEGEADLDPPERPAGPPSDEQKERIAALRKEAFDKVLAMLGEEQRQKFEELKGPPFEVNLASDMG
jgi:hypothetical protein